MLYFWLFLLFAALCTAGACLAGAPVWLGALCVALAEGRTLDEAARFASAASALSVTRMGAQTAMPSRPEAESFLENHSK